MNQIILLVLQIFAALLILIPLNGLLIHCLMIIAQKYKLRKPLVILLITGIAVSLPELLIGINSAAIDKSDLALGNAVGTGIVLMSFVAGLIAIFKKEFKTNELFDSTNITYISFAIIIFIFFTYDGLITQAEGFILVLLFVFYSWNLIQVQEKYSVIKVVEKITKTRLVITLLLLINILLVLFFITKFIVDRSYDIYLLTNLPMYLIGLLLLSPLGAIPELIFEFNLSNQNKSKLTMGELFSSLTINTTLVVGLVAMIKPIFLKQTNFFFFSALFITLLLILFNFYVRSKNSLNWKEGLVLIFIYLIFITSSYLLIF